MAASYQQDQPIRAQVSFLALSTSRLCLVVDEAREGLNDHGSLAAGEEFVGSSKVAGNRHRHLVLNADRPMQANIEPLQQLELRLIEHS